MDYARQIVKNALGSRVRVNWFEWSDGGGLFNKVFKVNASDGNFILKIECDKIFFATRKDQIENEVFGNKLFQKAGIPCAGILAYDFTRNNVGVRYILTEHIENEMDDCPVWGRLDDYGEATKTEITMQFAAALKKMRNMTCGAFGSLSPAGALGRHITYDGYYHSTLDLLIKDSEALGIFNDNELSVVKEAAAKPLAYAKEYAPAFVHGDMGYHNAIWGSVRGGEKKLYFFDFGNAYYGLPYLDEWICKPDGDGYDIIGDMGLDRSLYSDNLISFFERMFWKVTEQFTEDYAYCRDWIASSIEASKKDDSREHITGFVEKCRGYLNY